MPLLCLPQGRLGQTARYTICALDCKIAMRFFEYESRAIVAKAGIPVTKHGFATTADEARRIAEQIAGPVVIKSQVLTGGRMKAGGVQFADDPEQAERLAE